MRLTIEKKLASLYTQLQTHRSFCEIAKKDFFVCIMCSQKIKYNYKYIQQCPDRNNVNCPGKRNILKIKST